MRAVAGAAELPTVLIIGGLFFGENIGRGHLVAAVLIGAAVALTPSTRRAHVTAAAGPEPVPPVTPVS